MNQYECNQECVDIKSEDMHFFNKHDFHKKRCQVPDQADQQISKHNTCRPPNKAQYWLVLTDFMSVLIGYTFAFSLTLYTNEMLFDRELPWSDGLYINHFLQFLVISCCLLMWFENQGHYRNRIPLWIEFKQIFNAIILVMLVDVFLQFTFKQEFSRLFMISGWMTTAVVMVVGRSLTRNLLKKLGLWHIKVLVIGTGHTADKAIDTIKNESDLGYEYAGVVWPDYEELEQGLTNWRHLCEKHKAEHLIIAVNVPEFTNRIIDEVLRANISFSLFTVLQSLPAGNLSMHQFMNRRTFLIVHDSKLQQFLPRFLKRSSDIIFASIALLFLLPIMFIISLFVYLDGGPATFKHGRIGMHGKKFNCLKFRSMIQNSQAALKKHLAENPEAQAEWDRDQKLSNDPRISMIGAFLRKSSLDELPQLINVIRGEMSLVGPRPIVTEEMIRYGADIDYYTNVRPGITGLWQVSGRNNVSYDERVEMDAWYVRNWSIWLDIIIILKTIPALLSKSGAY